MRFILIFLLWTSVASPAIASSDAEQLLARMLAYHDPDESWMTQRVEMRLETGYADGRTSERWVTVDFANADYSDRVVTDGRVIEQSVGADGCRFWIDGQETSGKAELEAAGLNCNDARRRRDYTSYLWGLPMKLVDPGARVSPDVERTQLRGREVLDVTVTYDPEVGTDIWHFYVDPPTGRMVGYAFYKTSKEEHGEVIVLEGEFQVGNARIPSRRHWYEIPGDRFLGTDSLLEARVLPADGP